MTGTFYSEEGRYLYGYYKDKEDALIENYHQLLSSPAEEHFHQIRVSIKKMKACFRLLELMSCDFNSTKYLKPLRAVFKPAGVIREIQVNLNTLDKYAIENHKKEPYLRYCQYNLELAKNKLAEKLDAFSIETIKNNGERFKTCCKSLSHDDLVIKSTLFIQDRIDTIRDNLSFISDEFYVHQIRIKLKEISAVATVLKKIKVDGFGQELIASMRSFELELGEWHDRVMLERSLLKFLKEIDIEKVIGQAYDEVLAEMKAQNNIFLSKLEEKVLAVLNSIELPVKVVSDNL